MEIMNMLADLIMKLNHNLLFWVFKRIKYRTRQKKKFWTDRLLISKMIDALFFVFKRKRKKKKEKKNCKSDGPFSVQDPNCFSIFLMQVLHPKLLFLGDLSLQIGCKFYTTAGSACLYTVFLIYKSPKCFLPSFESTGLSVQGRSEK